MLVWKFHIKGEVFEKGIANQNASSWYYHSNYQVVNCWSHLFTFYCCPYNQQITLFLLFALFFRYKVEFKNTSWSFKKQGFRFLENFPSIQKFLVPIVRKTRSFFGQPFLYNFVNLIKPASNIIVVKIAKWKVFSFDCWTKFCNRIQAEA